MKKLLTFAAMATLAVGLVFVACKKEKNEKIDTNYETLETKERKTLNDHIFEDEVSFNMYIDSLIQETNVDVRLLATKTYITEFISEVSAEFDCMGTLTEEDGEYLLFLAQMVENFAQMDQMDSCLHYYELFCSYYNNKMDPCGMAYPCEQLVHNGTLYEVAFTSMNERKQKAVNIITGIEIDFPDFSNLSEEKKQELLSIAYFLNLEPLFLPQQDPYTLCVNRANQTCTAVISASSASYIIGLAGCSKFVLAPAIGACMAGYTAVYAIAIASAMHTRNVEIENCGYRYGNN